jgi:Zn-finger nucleic acid-binding protein
MNCVNCGAALPARSDICEYCNTRNDTDLRRFDVRPGEESDRKCPRCDILMETVTIVSAGATHVERCNECFGIFFDRYELEDLLEAAISRVDDVDFQRLVTLVEEGRKQEHGVGYVRCPVCANHMYRRAYGRQSGIVVDTCKAHGVWLDGGELGSILRWARIGGLTHSGGSVDLGWESGSGDGAEVPNAETEGDLDEVVRRALAEEKSASPLDALAGFDRRRGRGEGIGELVGDALADVFRFLDRALRGL